LPVLLFTCLLSLPFKLHTPLSHQLYSFQDANSEDDKLLLQQLIDESSKKVNRLQTSIDEINEMYNIAEKCFHNLVSSVEKFFSLLYKIHPEIKHNIISKLKKSTEILLISRKVFKTDITCEDNTFGQPDLSFNSADDKVIVSSILTLMKLEEENQANAKLQEERAKREKKEKQNQKREVESQHFFDR
jgi:hypothetical protein